MGGGGGIVRRTPHGFKIFFQHAVLLKPWKADHVVYDDLSAGEIFIKDSKRSTLESMHD